MIVSVGGSVTYGGLKAPPPFSLSLSREKNPEKDLGEETSAIDTAQSDTCNVVERSYSSDGVVVIKYESRWYASINNRFTLY